MHAVTVSDSLCTNGSTMWLWCGSLSAVCVFTDPPGPFNNTHPAGLSPNMTLVMTTKWTRSGFWIGLSLAIMSAFLIGGSVMLKKKALLRLVLTGKTRAGDGGHGYLRDWLWWSGLLTMGLGEVANFVAYIFAPATVVTPLGALSVLISAVLSSYLLGETLNVLGKLGCVLCVLGSTLMVLHAPQEEEVTSLQQMADKLMEPGFLVYASLLLLGCGVLIWHSAPRWGQSNILVYISICSLLGAFSVASAKGLGLAIRTVYSDSSVLRHPLTWILLVMLVVSIVTQVNYLNKSLDRFSTLLVYPIYYVLFTSVVLLTSVVLFQEWRGMAAVDVVAALVSFLVIVVGVAMLHLFKELQVTVESLSSLFSTTKEGAGHVEVVPGGVANRDDKYGLIDNMVVESLPPMREEGPRVFIIS